MRDGRVLVVHRERYDDWSLPKGHVEAGESWEDAALREVWEETGLRCELGDYLGATRYTAPEGEKEVRFWLMAGDGQPMASHEVDAVRWATPDEAGELLSYESERALLNDLR